MKEKEEDEKDRLRRRDRASVDRPSYRDRDRGERSHRPSGRHARTSRSPEPDAYEADRRKAIADREKNYRKGSAADTLLSPRRGDRGDRDLDRPYRSRREEAISHYDRERRDREDEREKLYRRRGDPRGSIDELPWGDEKPSRRRRADSDAESVGSSRLSKVRRNLSLMSTPKMRIELLASSLDHGSPLTRRRGCFNSGNHVSFRISDGN